MTGFTSDFLPFATGTSPTVITQAVYNALIARNTGFQAGVADEATCNKVWRQASIVSAMIGQFTADFGPSNVVDDGNIANLEAQFEAALVKYLTSYFIRIIPATYFYVNNSTGSDVTGTGLSSGAAWHSLTHALSALANYNLAGQTVILKMAQTGITYDPPPVFAAPSNGSLVILGDTAAQTSYVIGGSPPAGSSWLLTVQGGSVSLQGVTLANTSGTAGTANCACSGGSLQLQNVSFAGTTTAGYHIVAVTGGSVSVLNGCSFNASAVACWFAQYGGNISLFANTTTAGTPAWSQACAYAIDGGIIGFGGAGGWTFTNSGSTGPRYAAVRGGIIETAGGGANVFPGNVPGTAATGYYN